MDSPFHLTEIHTLRLSYQPVYQHILCTDDEKPYPHTTSHLESFFDKRSRTLLILFKSFWTINNDLIGIIDMKFILNFTCFSFIVFKYANWWLIKRWKSWYFYQLKNSHVKLYVCFTYFCIWNVMLHSKEKKSKIIEGSRLQFLKLGKLKFICIIYPLVKQAFL